MYYFDRIFLQINQLYFIFVIINTQLYLIILNKLIHLKLFHSTKHDFTNHEFLFHFDETNITTDTTNLLKINYFNKITRNVNTWKNHIIISSFINL